MLGPDHIGAFHPKRTPDGPMVVYWTADSDDPITLPDTEYDWGTASFGAYLLAKDVLEIVGGAEGRELEFMNDVIAEMTHGFPLTVQRVVIWRDGLEYRPDTLF